MTTSRLRALYEAATKGPWEVVARPGFLNPFLRGPGETTVIGESDAALIVAMHAALPALLAVAEAAENRCGVDVDGDCAICGGLIDAPRSETVGCAVTCPGRRLREALAALHATMKEEETGR